MADSTTQPAAVKSDDGRPVVLVIDDSQDVHRLLRARLKQEEVELIPAMSGAEGIKLATKYMPAAILLDIDMPGMDGFEVLRTLKDDPATLHLPVIILSGQQSAQDKVTAFELGSVDYITKPFEFTELRVRLRSVLRTHRLMQLLSQRAQLDGLTGLWNRLFFDSRWADEVSRNQRHARPLAVALLDVDHFKSVNDTYGHPAGDAVLQGVAKVLQRECRQSDVACRYGGEEFVIVMPDTSAADGAKVCDRIRAALEEISWPRHPERKITASFGIAGASGASALTPAAWVEAADRNLYAAKKGGRNRVVSSDVTAQTNLRAAS